MVLLVVLVAVALRVWNVSTLLGFVVLNIGVAYYYGMFCGYLCVVLFG